MAPEYCLLWIQWWPLCMTKAEWASWFQAIVALVAVYAGWRYVKHQTSEARKQLESLRADNVRSALNSLRVLALNLRNEMGSISASVHSEEDVNNLSADFDSSKLFATTEASLKDVTLHDLPGDVLLNSKIQLLNLIATARRVVEIRIRAMRGPIASDKVVYQLYAALGNEIDAAKKIEIDCVAALDAIRVSSSKLTT